VCAFFWGWRNHATWWIFFSESEKKKGGGDFVMQQSIRQFSKIWLLKNIKEKKIQTSFHLVGVWNLMRDLSPKKKKKSFLFQN
jgi:hypothetical protein